jgi:hypothetical protein
LIATGYDLDHADLQTFDFHLLLHASVKLADDQPRNRLAVAVTHPIHRFRATAVATRVRNPKIQKLATCVKSTP